MRKVSASPYLLNFSGPHGVGKDTLIEAVLQTFESQTCRVGTITTRRSAPEFDPSFNTVTVDSFYRLTAEGEWLVTSKDNGELFGTDLADLRRRGSETVFVHSVQASDKGAGELRRRFGPSLYSIGVIPPGGERTAQEAVLHDRMLSRGRDSMTEIRERMASQGSMLDYLEQLPTVSVGEQQSAVFNELIVNSDLARTIRYLRCRVAAVFGLDRQ